MFVESASVLPAGAAAARGCRPIVFAPLVFVGLVACGASAGAPTRAGAPTAPPTNVERTATGISPRFTALNDTCALAADGRIFCWGLFEASVEKTPDEVNHARPIAGITDAAMFAGRSNLCYVHRSDGRRISCLARARPGGPLAPASDHVLPEPVRELAEQCAITTSSAIYCWGSSAGRHFLTGEAWSRPEAQPSRQVPPTKLPLPPVRNFVRSLHGLCVATEAGRIGCWGANNFVETREALAGTAPANHGVQEMRWLDAPSGSIGAFAVGLQVDYFESHKDPLCYQREDNSFSCENPRATQPLVDWLHANAIVQVQPLGDAVLGRSADGTLRAFLLRARPRYELPQVLTGRTLTGVVAFGAHHDHACILDRAGQVACVGVRDDGYLGTGERLSSPTPVEVDVPPAVELSSNGLSQFCTRQASGRVHCWGGYDAPDIVAGRQAAELALPEPSRGIVGGETLCTKGAKHWWCTSPFVRASRPDGFSPLRDPAGRLVPLDAELASSGGIGLFVASPGGARAVFWFGPNREPLVTKRYGAKGERPLPGTRNCIRTATNTAACADYAGSVYWIETPPGVAPRQLLASRSEVALLTMNGELYFGARGYREPVRWETSPRMTGLRDAIAIPNPDQSGASSICVLREAGEVLCRGHNRYGELGDGTFAPREAFRPVTGLADVRAIAGGRAGACALDAAGAVRCWGSDAYGALGQGSKRFAETPVPIAFPPAARSPRARGRR